MDVPAAEAPSDSEVFVSNPALGAAGADDPPGRGPGDGASTKAADLPPASELLPKLHLALKMAGHGNWPRLAAPVLLLPLICCITTAYWALHLHALNADLRDILCIYFLMDGPAIAGATALLHRRTARADGTGALDVLERLPISPEGAQDLKRAEFWAGNAPTSPLVAIGIILASEPGGMASGWRSETVRFICYGAGFFLGGGFGVFPQIYATVGADLACCAIVRDQLRQTARRLGQLVSSSVASQAEPAFNFRATMAELHRLKQHVAQCERTGASVLLIAGYAYAACGSLLIYGAATGDPDAVVLNAFFIFFGSLYFAQTIDLLLGPMSVTAGAPLRNYGLCRHASERATH